MAARTKSAPLTLYGFRTCVTVRNAMKWLESHKVPYELFDYRRTPLDAATIDDLFARGGWENVFNRNSTTFRELPDSAKEGITKAKARRMILEHSNLLKRPILDTGDQLLLGFKPEAWAEALGK